MFRIPQSALKYEKYRRLLEEEEQQMQQDPNAQQQDPNAQQQDPNAQQQEDPNAMQQPQEDGAEMGAGVSPSGIDTSTPEGFYDAGLAEIQNQIATTGRKRYQRYKLNGGRDSWEVFKKNLEDSLKQDLEDECKEQFGYNPGKSTEKDILIMIKNGIDQLNQAMAAGMAQDQQAAEDPNAQQAMQEAYDFISERQYRNYMRKNRF